MDRTDEAMGFKAEYPNAPTPTKEEAQKLLQLYKLPASMIPVLGAAITTWDIMSDVKQAYDKGGKEAVVELLKEEAPFYAAEAVGAALGPIAAAAKGTKTAARALKAAKPVKKVPRNVKVPRGAPGGGPLRPWDREMGRKLRTDPDFRKRMKEAAAIKRKQKAARGAEKRLDQTVSSAMKRSARKERLDYLEKQRKFYDSEAEFIEDFGEEIDELKKLISRSEPEKKARRRAAERLETTPIKRSPLFSTMFADPRPQKLGSRGAKQDPSALRKQYEGTKSARKTLSPAIMRAKRPGPSMRKRRPNRGRPQDDRKN